MKPKLLTFAALVFAASTAIAQTGATAGSGGSGGPGSSAAGANTGATAGGAGGTATGGGATMTPGVGGAAAGGAATGAMTGGPATSAAPNPAAAPRQLDDSMVPGWSTMSAKDRSEIQRQMSGFTNYAECTAYMSKHRQQMQSRSGQGSTATAGTPVRDACDHLPRR